MKTIIKTNYLEQPARLAMTLLLTLFTTFTASAKDFITDVMLIGHDTEADINELKSSYVAQGWKVYDYDLNKGAGGDWIYLLYKTQSSPSNVNDGTFITDFYIKDGKDGYETVNEWLYNDGRTYRLVPYDGRQHFKEQQGDLNSGTGSSSNSIHLYYTRDRFSDNRAICGFRIDDEGYDALCSDGVTDMAPFNLNAGCKSGSAEIYMHIDKTTALPFRGAGTEYNPYLIGTNAEWERFATLVSQGKYTDLCYKMDESITVTKMAGTSYQPFRGTFDGGEYYLTLNIDGSEDYAAPFRYVDGATLKNFVVRGWCMGGIHTAGLVGSCAGTVSIKSCKVGANVTTSASHVGGIVGHGGASTLTIEGSFFNGSINGFTDVAGGILGWCDDATLTMNNCLFKGSFSPGTNGKYNPIVCYNIDKNPNVTFTSVYYMNTQTPTAYYFPESYFKTLSEEYVYGSFESQIKAADGQSYYVRAYGLDLPYSYGFENNDLNAEGWKFLNSNVSAIVSDDYYQAEGTYCLRVSLQSDQTHYLISPEFKELSAISMKYNQRVEFNAPTYRVGYSTTTNDISSFIWGNWKQYSSTSWTREQQDFPKGTKYIAFEFGTNISSFVMDEFLFSTSDTPAPQSLTLTGITDVSATLSWDTPGTDATVTRYVWQYKKASDSSWSTEVTTGTIDRTATISGLSGYTVYNFQVKAVYSDGEESMWQSISFRTSMPLPFECGFENDGDLDKWTMKDVHWGYTRVYDVGSQEGADPLFTCPYNGKRNFSFHAITDNPHPQYLISPQFNGKVPIEVSFYYRNRQADIWDTFEVGVSYSNDDISSFSWGPTITAFNGEWRLYDNIFLGDDVKPRYIAIKYTGNRETLYIDDVIFGEGSSSAKPSKLTVSSLTNQSATLTWTAPTGATGYAYRYKLATGNSWSEGMVNSASVTLTGLSANTSYDFRVRALYASAPVSNETEIRFLTEGNVQALPFFEYFNDGLGSWRLVNGDGDSEISRGNEEDINYGFLFFPYFEDQYLISPEFAGDKSIMVSFSHRDPTDEDKGRSKFRVGWSTTTKDISAFNWGPEVESSAVKQNYCIQVPQGTRYVAIRKITGDSYTLFLNDFGFIDAEQFVIQATKASLFGEDKYVTTFYTRYCSFKLPENARAYTATLDGDEVVLHQVGDDGSIIPRSTGVVVVADRMPGDDGETKDLVMVPLLSTDVVAPEENILWGFDEQVLVIDGKLAVYNVYVMGVKDGKLGFYWFNEGYEPTLISQRKAFLQIPVAEGSTYGYIVRGPTTYGDANGDEKVNVVDIVKLVDDKAPQADIDAVVRIIMGK